MSTQLHCASTVPLVALGYHRWHHRSVWICMFGGSDNWSPYWSQTTPASFRCFKMVDMAAILDVMWPPISAWTILLDSNYHACEFHWDRTKLRFIKMVAMVAILDATWPPISAWTILIGPPTYHACEFHWDRTKFRFFKMAAMAAILDVTWPLTSAWTIFIGPLPRLKISLRSDEGFE
jgi:hypothetical protein